MKAARRKKLKRNQFAIPSKRAYPIDTKKRARNALARSAQDNTSSNYQQVAKAVRRKYGDSIATVGKTKGTVTHPGYRKTKKG